MPDRKESGGVDQDQNMDTARPETETGFGRFGTILKLKDWGSDQQLQQEYAYAMTHGLIEPDFTFQTYKHLRTVQDLNVGSIMSPTGQYLGEPLVNYAANPAVCEPSYIELLGQQEISRLRSLPAPRFLLAGSAGKESSLGFARLAAKINPNATLDVIDLKQSSSVTGDVIQVRTTKGSALKMDYPNGTFDVCSTNNLLHELEGSGDLEEDLRQLISQFENTLKIGGNLIIYEAKSEKNAAILNKQKLLELILASGRLKQAALLERALIYHFPGENGKATIDQNSQGHYENVCLREVPVGALCARFEKI